MIIPALLEAEATRLKTKLKILQKYFDRIHIDVVSEWDKVDEVSIPEGLVFEERKMIEIHLMVNDPVKYLEKLKKKRVDLVYAQVESLKDKDIFVEKTRELDLKCGLVIDLKTEIDRIKSGIGYFNKFILMAVEAGRSGQKFDNKVLDKIKELREICGNNAEINIDGGINLESGKRCFKAGADGLLVNSFLWEDFENNLYNLKLIDKS